MTTVIMSLYDDEEVFEGIRESLLDGGFETGQIQSLHRNPRNASGFVYQETPGHREGMSLEEARELLRGYEFKKQEVEEILTKVQAHKHLLLVRTGAEHSGRAMEILNEEPVEARRREDSFDDSSGGLVGKGN